jgi:hypothetical protein
LILFALVMAPVLAQPQNHLDNAAVIRLVSEGTPSSTIIQIIANNGSSGFRFAPADLLALGRANVPEEVVNAMMGKSAPMAAPKKASFVGTILNNDAPTAAVTSAPVVAPAAPPVAQPVAPPAVEPAARLVAQPAAPHVVQPAAPISGPTMSLSGPSLTIPEGTKIRVRLEEQLSSASATEGQLVQLSVVEAVRVNGVEAIPIGSPVHGTVVTAVPKRMMGRTGKLDISITEVVANGRKIPVRYSIVKKEGGSTAVSTGIITAGVAVLFWPAAPFVLLRHGKDYTFNQGMTFEVFTDSDSSIVLAAH